MEDSKDLFGICPIATAQKILGGKWTILILYYLSEGTLRFGELQRKIPTLTQSMLTKQLRSLESDGLIHRKIYPEVPPKVEYSLTDMGKKFIPVLDALALWGESYKDHLKVNS